MIEFLMYGSGIIVLLALAGLVHFNIAAESSYIYKFVEQGLITKEEGAAEAIVRFKKNSPIGRWMVRDMNRRKMKNERR